MMAAAVQCVFLNWKTSLVQCANSHDCTLINFKKCVIFHLSSSLNRLNWFFENPGTTVLYTMLPTEKIQYGS
jgi:predicted metalloenzyme YecM